MQLRGMPASAVVRRRIAEAAMVDFERLRQTTEHAPLWAARGSRSGRPTWDEFRVDLLSMLDRLGRAPSAFLLQVERELDRADPWWDRIGNEGLVAHLVEVYRPPAPRQFDAPTFASVPSAFDALVFHTVFEAAGGPTPAAVRAGMDEIRATLGRRGAFATASFGYRSWAHRLRVVQAAAAVQPERGRFVVALQNAAEAAGERGLMAADGWGMRWRENPSTSTELARWLASERSTDDVVDRICSGGLAWAREADAAAIRQALEQTSAVRVEPPVVVSRSRSGR